MEKHKDAEELSSILLKLITGGVEHDVISFQDKYQVALVKNWRPWPKCPEEIFQKSFVVCSSECKLKSCANNIGSLDSANDSKGMPATPFIASHKKSSGDSNDRTGFPLECVFDLTLMEVSMSGCCSLKKPSCSHLSVPACDARYLCELYTIYCNDAAFSEIPLVVVCSGEDRQNTILRGASKSTRIVCCNQGPLTKQSMYANLNKIRTSHLLGFRKNFSKIETMVYTYYDIFGESHKSPVTSVLLPNTNGILALECSGRQLLGILDKPTADVSCVMLIQTILGDEYTGATAKYKELKRLQTLYSSMEAGTIVWPGPPENGHIVEELTKFLESLKCSRASEYVQKKPLLSKSSDFDSTFSSRVTGDRDDMDFTDRVWMILSGCGSYEELVCGFSFIMKELKDFAFVPYIYRKNMTYFANLIRTVTYQPVVGPPMESATPFKLLMEIGIEKLRKDYISLFVGLDMVPYQFMLPFMKQNQDFEKGLSCLQKFHTILELLIICWSTLHVSHSELSIFARALIKFYTDVPKVDPDYIFRYQLPFWVVSEVFNSLEPSLWDASLKSSSSGYEKRTVINITRTSDDVGGTVSMVGTPCQLSKPMYCTTSAVLVIDHSFDAASSAH